MKLRLRMSNRARRNLEVIAEYVGSYNAAAAVRLLQRLRARAHLAARHPWAGRQVQELEDDSLREAIVGSYRMVYRVTASEVIVVLIMEGHRILQDNIES